MKDTSTLVAKRTEKKEDTEKKLVPEILLAGERADLLGLTEPAHMCSNCWNNKNPVTGN